MRTGLSAIAVGLLLLFVAGRAEAGRFEFKAARVSVEVPKGWGTADEVGTVTFTSKDQMLAINLAYAQGTSVDAAWDLLISESQKVVAGFSAEKKEGVFGGLDVGYVGSGAGTMGGASVEALVAVFPAPGGSMTVFALGVVGKYEKHEKAMMKFLSSLRGVSVLVEDDQFEAAPADGRKFAVKLARAIGDNDGKGFLKMVGKAGFFDGRNQVQLKASKLKGELKARGGKVHALVDMPATGDFHLLWNAGTGDSFQLYRGEPTGAVTYVTVKKEKKKWVITGSTTQAPGAK